ncbi:MAG: cobalt ABC transporter permease [Alphaproteobacteria bacterium]
MRELAIALLMVVTASTSFAHKVILSAWSAGDVVEGEVGLSSGELVQAGTVVRVLGPDGDELGRTEVGDDGMFRFEPVEPVPHRFVADLGQGHVAETTLDVDELPAAVAAGDGATGSAEAATPAAQAAAEAATEAVDAEQLETVVATAIQRELAPLKRRLAAREQEADLQALIGGIGYICGIFGLLFFVYARRQRR